MIAVVAHRLLSSSTASSRWQTAASLLTICSEQQQNHLDDDDGSVLCPQAKAESVASDPRSPIGSQPGSAASGRWPEPAGGLGLDGVRPLSSAASASSLPRTPRSAVAVA